MFLACCLRADKLKRLVCQIHFLRVKTSIEPRMSMRVMIRVVLPPLWALSCCAWQIEMKNGLNLAEGDRDAVLILSLQPYT